MYFCTCISLTIFNEFVPVAPLPPIKIRVMLLYVIRAQWICNDHRRLTLFIRNPTKAAEITGLKSLWCSRHGSRLKVREGGLFGETQLRSNEGLMWVSGVLLPWPFIVRPSREDPAESVNFLWCSMQGSRLKVTVRDGGLSD